MGNVRTSERHETPVILSYKTTPGKHDLLLECSKKMLELKRRDSSHILKRISETESSDPSSWAHPCFKKGTIYPAWKIKTLTLDKKQKWDEQKWEEQKTRRLAEAPLAACDTQGQAAPSQTAPSSEIDADSISLADALILLAGAALSLSAITLCCYLLCSLLHRGLERFRKPQGPILPVWDEKRLK